MTNFPRPTIIPGKVIVAPKDMEVEQVNPTGKKVDLPPLTIRKNPARVETDVPDQ